MRPALSADFEQAIAKPRLDSYRRYFHVTLDEAVGLYMWNIELSSCISALLCHFEIALRNNVHRAMSHFYSRGTSASYAWYDTIWAQLTPHLRDKITAVRQKHKKPGPDEIVSRLTFGFWPGVINIVDARYAGTLFPAIFPNHPLNAVPSDWLDANKRKLALAYLTEMNIIRNRLAHHEPVWKFAAVTDQATGTRLPGTIDLRSSLSRFGRLLGQYDGAMMTLNPSLAADVSKSSWRTRTDFLLSTRGFDRYRQQKHVAQHRLTPAQLRRTFFQVVQANQVVSVGGGRTRGLFIPSL